MVIDIKDYSGYLSYRTDMPEVKASGADLEPRMRYPNRLIKKLHDRNIYVVGRISVFQDSVLAKARPEWALGTEDGGIWADRLPRLPLAFACVTSLAFAGQLEEGQRVAARVPQQDLQRIRVGHRVTVLEAATQPGGQIRLADRFGDSLGDQLAGARMGGVAFDDHRTAGGERRGGVAPGGREGEREVGSAEHHHRTDGNLAQPQVRARQRLGICPGPADQQNPRQRLSPDRRQPAAGKQ